MKKVLFLTLHRPDRSPSQRFRFEQYLTFLESNGFSYDFSYLLNAKDDKLFYSKGKYLKKTIIVLKSMIRRFKELKNIKKYDLIYIQRESFMLGTSFFERQISKKGVNLIFDFDDSIWLQNVSDANKAFVWLKNPKKTAEIIECSTLIFAGNEYLADYARQYNKNIEIIPTTIDTDKYIRQESEKDKIIIGWSGSITTIQHFEFAIPFLKQLKKKYNGQIAFKVIGNANYQNKELDIQGIAWTEASEIRELSTFDIGIMPLPDDEWAKGKCGLKGLQYMALEIPTIMSPVGVNTEIIQNGENGYLATSIDEWVDKISLLIESEELRKNIGKEGRKTVVDKYSIHANKGKYLNSFSKLAQ